jgi:hypothetical protein
MATKDSDFVKNNPFHGEQGNESVWYGEYAKAGVLSGDIIRMCVVPAGARVDDMKFTFDDCGTGMTAKVGYAPVNSVDGPAASDAYWGTGIDIATAAGVNRTSAHSIRFDFDVYVIVTISSANFTGSPKIAVAATGEYQGTK